MTPKETKMNFDPNNFFAVLTIADIADKFPELHPMDFTKISLNEELTKRNYEIVTQEYRDFGYKTLKEYYWMEIDTIV